MLVNKVEKRDELSLIEIVKYQIVNYCYFENITISDASALCVAYLCINGKTELNKFCNEFYEKKIFATPQVVRNAVGKAVEKGIVIKEGTTKKIIYIDPDMNIQHTGNILLDYKFLCRESL